MFVFSRINGYTMPELTTLYKNFMNFSQEVPMANNENNSASYMTRRIGGTTYKVRV